jgi:hypothetical protein
MHKQVATRPAVTAPPVTARVDPSLSLGYTGQASCVPSAKQAAAGNLAHRYSRCENSGRV